MSQWGKHFGKMYEGSMLGKGAMVFALMGYVIAKMQCKWVGEGRAKIVTEGTVTLNLTLLHAIFGEPVDMIQKAIDALCAPDPETSTEGEEGRRLVKTGQFEYRVVNAPKYQNLRNQEEKREKNRLRQQEFRDRQKKDRETWQIEKDIKRAKERRKKVSTDAGRSWDGSQWHGPALSEDSKEKIEAINRSIKSDEKELQAAYERNGTDSP